MSDTTKSSWDKALELLEAGDAVAPTVAPAGGGSSWDKAQKLLAEPSFEAPSAAPDRSEAYRKAMMSNLAEGSAAPSGYTAEEYEKMPWSEYLPIVGSNILPSAGRAISGVYTAGKEIGTGLASKAGIPEMLGYDASPEAKAEREAFLNALSDPKAVAKAIGEDYYNRYGGAGAGEFWKRLAEDPAAYGMDVASVIPFAGQALKGAQLLDKGSKIAKAMELTRFADPVQAALEAPSVAAKIAGKTASVASGVSDNILSRAYEIGKSGDPRRIDDFMTYMRRNPQGASDIANTFEKAIDEFGDSVENDYLSSISTARSRTQPVNMVGVSDARDGLQSMLVPSPTTGPVWYPPGDVDLAQKAIDRIDDIMTQPNAAARTIEGLIPIKKELGRLGENIRSADLKGRVFDVSNALVRGMSDVDPAYGQAMKIWSNYKEQLNNIRRDLGSENLSDAQKAKKIEKQFGLGSASIAELEKMPSGAALSDKITGLAGNKWLNDKVHNTVAALGGLGAAGMFYLQHPNLMAPFLVGAAATSPKVVTWGALQAGRAADRLRAPSAILEGVRSVSTPITNIGSQLGEAMPTEQQYGARYSGGRAERKAGGRVGVNHERIADQLVTAAERAKKGISEDTKPLLDLPDNHIAQALEVANRSI